MLEILYRDAHYVAVHKPSRLLVHPTELAPGETSCLSALRNQLGQWVYPVHRLDRGTSGVLLFALSPDAAQRMGALFRARRMRKYYLAVVRGYVDPCGQIAHPFEDSAGEGSREAVTDYVRKATVELPYTVGRYSTARYSLVRAEPHTGRQHQIRRHFAHISHPVVGDTNYGDGAHNRLFRERFGVGRLLLMATGLAFEHPYTGDPVSIRAGVPGAVRALFRRFEWDVCSF